MRKIFGQQILVAQMLALNPFDTEAELAKALGMSPNTWTARKQNRSPFTLDEITKACDVLHLDPFALLLGDERAYETAKPDRPAVPNLLTHAGMGNGGLEAVEVDEAGKPHDLFTDGDWSFPSGISSGFRSHQGVYALEVEGDSMEPNYRGGSTVFVDTKNTRPSPPGVFIVDYGDGLLLKRVELIGGTDMVAIISDNKDLYRSYEFPRDQVTIWGRVIAKWEWVK